MSGSNGSSTTGRRVPRLSRLATVTMAIATALLSAALGVAPDLLVPPASGDERNARFKVMGVLGVLGLVALMAGVWIMWFRDRLLSRRGTAYIVDAAAQEWESDAQQRRFFKQLERQFASILHVPGPNDLSSSWRWPNAAPGARLWTGGVDDLVLSFRCVNRNDEQSTHNNVMAWLPWPAAVAWVSRLLTVDRGLPLYFRQRPSGGRQGVYGVDSWSVAGHDFANGSDVKPVPAETHSTTVRLTLTSDQPVGQSEAPALRILLLRATTTNWGPLGLDLGNADGPAELEVIDFADVGATGQFVVELREWRYQPIDRLHPWDDYPSMVASAADWIAENALNDGVTLIGSLVPQEMSLGLGANVARRAEGSWPQHLWPIYKFNALAPMVIPGLDLGWRSTHQTGASPRCS